MRLTKGEDIAGRTRTPSRRRRKRKGPYKSQAPASPSDSEADAGEDGQDEANLVPQGQEMNDKEAVSAMDKELREMEDDEIRRTNAYSGAKNTIGSVHQRKWYLSLDKNGVGYKRGEEGKWYLGDETWGEDAEVNQERNPRISYPFYLKGVEEERSVVTGRKGEHILQDEGVWGYVGRKGWQPVLN